MKKQVSAILAAGMAASLLVGCGGKQTGYDPLKGVETRMITDSAGRKMGKSEGNGIYLSDTDEAIRKKVMKAVTDSGPTAPDSPMPEVIANLFTLLKVVSSPDTVQFFTDKWNRCEIRYGDLKKQLAEDIIRVVAPIRERIRDIAADEAYLARVVKQGAEKARASASVTVTDVRRIMGIKPF